MFLLLKLKLGHMNCLSQWDNRKQDLSLGLIDAYTLEHAHAYS